MARLLLLMTTTTYKAQAFMQAAARLDVPVVVGSDRRQALQGANPDGHLTLDFQAPEAAARDIVAAARLQPFLAVVAADDDGVLVAAHAAEALGLAHNPPVAVAAARNKLRMRRTLAAAGAPGPRFLAVSVECDPTAVAAQVSAPTPAAGAPVGYPCVVKPLGLSASRGVIRADDASQLVVALRRVADIVRQRDVAAAGGDLARQLLIESFVPGIEVALEGIVEDGRLRVLALFDKPDPLEGPFFEETIYVTPSRLDAATQAAITGAAAQAVEALGLRTGPVHAELRSNASGACLLELAPRSIGGLCSKALRFTGELSLEDLILRQALGRDVTALARETVASGVMMIPIPHAGILRGVGEQAAARGVPGVEDLRITIPVGQPVVPPPEGGRYLGFIFARAATPQAVEAALRASHARLRIDIEPAHGANDRRHLAEFTYNETEVAVASPDMAGSLGSDPPKPARRPR